MKTFFIKIGFIILLFISCNHKTEINSEKEIKLLPGKIIGFDQCDIKGSYIIVVDEDTLVTYDKLDSLYGSFPEYYYDKALWEFMFPLEERNKYPVYINYSLVEEKDKKRLTCFMDPDLKEFFKFVRDRQVKINYITKIPLTSVRMK